MASVWSMARPRRQTSTGKQDKHRQAGQARQRGKGSPAVPAVSISPISCVSFITYEASGVPQSRPREQGSLGQLRPPCSRPATVRQATHTHMLVYSPEGELDRRRRPRPSGHPPPSPCLASRFRMYRWRWSSLRPTRAPRTQTQTRLRRIGDTD